MTAITTLPKRRLRSETMAAETPRAHVLKLFDANGGLRRLRLQESCVPVGMTGRARRFQIRVLVVHGVARFKVGRQCYRTGNHETRLRRALPGENSLLCGVNTDMTAGRLTSPAYIARDIEFRSPMLRVAFRASDFFLLVDGCGFLVGMTALATGIWYAPQT